MRNKMFGHFQKKRDSTEKSPGLPYNAADFENAELTDVSTKEYPKRSKERFEEDQDNPPGYEGKEHVKYEDPGYSSHHIKYPEDEPHMKSHVNRDETHEMEDNYHMDIPDQTEHSLEAKIKRARMKMDAPDQEEPDDLRGNIVHPVGFKGEIDTSGDEEMGPNDMQKGMSKENRKKMIVAVTKRKMKKNKY